MRERTARLSGVGVDGIRYTIDVFDAPSEQKTFRTAGGSRVQQLDESRFLIIGSQVIVTIE
jgi:hypothetical protein